MAKPKRTEAQTDDLASGYGMNPAELESPAPLDLPDLEAPAPQFVGIDNSADVPTPKTNQPSVLTEEQKDEISAFSQFTKEERDSFGSFDAFRDHIRAVAASFTLPEGELGRSYDGPDADAYRAILTEDQLAKLRKGESFDFTPEQQAEVDKIGVPMTESRWRMKNAVSFVKNELAKKVSVPDTPVWTPPDPRLVALWKRSGEPGRVNLDGREYIIEQWLEGPRFIDVGPTQNPNMFNPKTTIGRF